MRVVRVVPTSGMQVANPTVAGSIRIAGVSPAGFSSGELALLTFIAPKGRRLGTLRLMIGEASTTGGASLLKDVAADGWPVATIETPGIPVIDSISPRAAEIESERVTDLVLYGRGFASRGNVVLFDGAEVPGLLSEAKGTVIRFTAPTSVPAAAGTSRRVTPGPVRVRVKHEKGTSNAVTFTVREGGVQ
jgi:hypothetical protein